VNGRTPSIFVCYRRADEPFAAALTASILEDAVGADEFFLDTGKLPGKPNGSTVVYVTRSVVGVAQLTEDLRSHPVIRLPLIDLGTGRTDRHRLSRRVTDLELTSGDRTVRIEGIFGEEADELVETVDRRPGELGGDSRP
jgi:hypothetical protein